jgi:hypothetical protein
VCILVKKTQHDARVQHVSRNCFHLSAACMSCISVGYANALHFDSKFRVSFARDPDVPEGGMRGVFLLISAMPSLSM